MSDAPQACRYFQYKVLGDRSLSVREYYKSDDYITKQDDLLAKLEHDEMKDQSYVRRHYIFIDRYPKYQLTPVHQLDGVRRQIQNVRRQQKERQRIDEVLERASMKNQQNDISNSVFKPRMMTSAYKQRRSSSAAAAEGRNRSRSNRPGGKQLPVVTHGW